MRTKSELLTLAAFLPIGFGATALAPRPSIARRRDDGQVSRIREGLARLPLAFVENCGQTDERVRFYAQGSRHAFHLTREGVVLSFVEDACEPGTRGIVLELRFHGSDRDVVLEGGARASGAVNIFRGSDPSRWHTELPRYAEIVYRELWPGVDLAVQGRVAELKYEFRVRPGARLADASLGYDGASGLALDDEGGLRIETAMGELRDTRPIAYQDVDGERVPVECRYVLRAGSGAGGEYGFALGEGYDPRHELIIDPSLDYSTLLGGSSDDSIAGIAVDGAGNAYVVGVTQASDLPTTPGAFDRLVAGPSNPTDIFVTKLNATGTALVYSTFVGTGGFDWGRALAVDAAGNAYVTGQTASQDFPTTGGAFDRTLNTSFFDRNDCIVFKLNAAGSSLAYSTYLGGTSTDDGLAIAVDGNGSAYVAGETTSSDFPTTAGAFDRTSNGSNDTFVTKLNPLGSALVYSTLLGGADNELPEGVFVDAAGNAFIGGSTRSFDYPTTPGAFDTVHSAAPFDELFDLYVTKLNPSGSALVYSTFLGGPASDFGGAFAVDAAGNAYLVGGTLSPDFPTTPGTFDPVFAGTSESFVAKLNPSGSALVYSTFLGEASAGAIAPDPSGNAWLAGSSSSPTAATTADAFDRTFNGGTTDAYVAELNATGSALLFASFLGGADNEGCAGVALDSGGNVYVAGRTLSVNFPTTASAFNRLFQGDPLVFWGEAFVARIGGGLPPTPPGTPAAPSLLAPPNLTTVAQPITFDWSDATDAATYVIQIDNSSNFTTPLTLSQSVSASQATIGGLPAQRLFWRVRGVNSAGVAGPFSAARRFTAQAVAGVASLSAVSVSPASVVGGNGATGTVTLTGAASSGGLLVSLASSSAAATVPASVTVAAGATSATFAVTTSSVASSTAVTITATQSTTTRTAALTVNPVPPPASLGAISLNPSALTGGAFSTGTATLTSAAPSGGIVVTLASSNAAAASVPASVTVAAGATSASFTVTTSSVASATAVTITGTG